MAYPRPRYDESFRAVIADLTAVATNAGVARWLGVSPNTVRRHRAVIEAFGTHIPPLDLVRQGRPPSITVAMGHRIAAFIAAELQSPMLDEIQDMLLVEYDVCPSISTISRTLKKLNITHKRGQRVHPGRNEDVRDAWRSRIALQYRAHQVVYVDESASNERNLDRRWGWSPKGTAYRMTQSCGSRANSYSILPAMDMNGYLHYEIYPGSYDGDRFVAFVRSLLPKMTPFPGPRSVLIWDNNSTHGDSELEELAEQYGVIIESLPAYSPDLNAIEESFAVLKAWIKRHRYLIPHFGGDYVSFSHTAVAMSDLGSRAVKLIERCGVAVDESIVYEPYEEL